MQLPFQMSKREHESQLALLQLIRDTAANMIEIIYNTTGGRIGVVTLKNGDAYMIGTDFGPGGKQVAERLLERMLDTFEITK